MIKHINQHRDTDNIVGRYDVEWLESVISIIIDNHHHEGYFKNFHALHD